MMVGYARTSTTEQKAGLEAQLAELVKIGVERVFQEQVSAVGQRRILEEALDFCRDGDVFIVTKLDRLARSIRHLTEVVDRLEHKRVCLRILNLNLDTSTPTGKLMLNLLAAIASFEREIMLERQRDGIADAQRQGKYRGRAPTARNKASAVLKLISEGQPITQVAKQLKISRASAYRIRKLANVSHV